MKKLLIATLFIFLSIGFSLAQTQQQFTLEQVMSAPFPSNLTAAPEGGSVAWIQIAKGVRNVWVAGPPDYKGRQLTSYKEDDGEEIGELVWTADGKAVIYTRGGDLDSFGEGPNPSSAPEEPKQLLWIVRLDGKPPAQLAEGHSGAVSPKDNRLAYISKREIWSLKIDGSEKPGKLIQPKGRADSIRWSPDGSKLAFVNGRGDHGFIGVYDLSARIVRYLDASVDRNNEPVWRLRPSAGANRNSWP